MLCSFQDFQFTLEAGVRKLFQMLRIAFFIILLSTSGLGHAGSDDLLQKGLSAYQNKQFAEAKEDFQKLLDQNKSNPSLLHNLALADYQLDQKPLALALWRKALTIQPSFQPARAGRDLLEGKMQMRPLERDSLSLWAHRGLEQVSWFATLVLNALLLGITGWLGLTYLGERAAALDEERTLPAFPTWAIVLLILFLASTALSVLKGNDTFTERATVIGAKVSARSLPADDSVGLFDLNGGSEVLVKRTEPGWEQVQNGEGSSGWVKDSEIFVTSEH